ncbi:hypothetical protein SDC9_140349 [bioreactor metagenome]|uniref:Pre-toxin TG domain-containing protein n=1 Tax=bioreactor metagenome TaxID=1076179 RepID=A0A645DX83_9ZZZZ
MDTVSKAVSYVEDVASNVWDHAKKAYNYVADNVKNWVNSTKKTVDSYVTKAEQKISSAKENIKNTANKMVQLAKPVISTMSHPNEVVRLAMDTIKKGCEGAQYVASQAYKYKEQILDGVQLVLDIAGIVPVIGDVLDGVNGVISLARGNVADAALSFGAMIPLAGGAVTAAKLARKGEKAIDVAKAAGKAFDVVKDGEKALDMTKALGKNADEIAKEVSKVQTGGRELSVEEYLRRLDKADEMYDAFIKSTTDVQNIAKNTGMSESRIQRIKDHVFNNIHIKENGVGRFDADYEMGQAWERLQKGTYKQSDIDLLNHELFESKFEGIFKTDYRTAHDKTIEAGRPWNP